MARYKIRGYCLKAGSENYGRTHIHSIMNPIQHGLLEPDSDLKLIVRPALSDAKQYCCSSSRRRTRQESSPEIVVISLVADSAVV